MEILLVAIVLSGIVALLAGSGHTLAAVAIAFFGFIILWNATLGS